MSRGARGWWSENFKDPTDQEKKTAAKINGARREIASGAFSGKYDVNSKSIMIDNKLTDKHSFSLDYRKFKEILDKTDLEQMPALVIAFAQYGDSLAVIREADLMVLLRRYDENQQ